MNEPPTSLPVVRRPRLQSTLQVPWDRTTRLGLGFDVVTYQLSASPFQEPLIASSNGTHPKVNSSFSTITNHQELHKHIDASLDASATVFGASIKAAYKHANSIHFSSMSMTIVLRCTIEFPPAFYTTRPTLAANAENLLSSDQKRFHDIYGSHFIAGHVSKSTLYASTTFHASSQEKLNALTTRASVNKGVGAISANARYIDAAADSEIRVEFRCISDGFEPGELPENPSANDIQSLIKKYERQKPKHEVALLEHYSMIDQRIKSDDGGFHGPNGIRVAIKTVLRARRKYASCPLKHAQGLLEEVVDVGNELVCLEPTHSDWKASLQSLKNELERLCCQLDVCEARQGLLYQAENHKTKENSIDQHADETPFYDFGVTETKNFPASVGNEVKDSQESQPKNLRYHSKLNWEWKSSLRIEVGVCILGFRVENCWASSTNGRFSVTSGGVGYNHVEVKFTSLRTRGTHWRLRAWYVEGPVYI